MADFNINSPNSTMLPRWFGRAVDYLSWAVLIIVIGVVIAGLIRRAQFEHNYGIAAVIALFGALVLMIGLAQQAIAARDIETWREMAEWQLRAAKERLGQDTSLLVSSDSLEPEHYNAVITYMLIEEMKASHFDGRTS